MHKNQQNILPVAATAEIRAYFPALARLHNGRQAAYFDGPGGTQVPTQVAEAMVDYLFHHNANTHWAYPTSAETDEALTSARETFSDFLNAAPEEIVFGANMTTLTFHLARALARGFSARDEILVTELDHHANVDPWREAALDSGCSIQTVKMIPEKGELDWDDFRRKLTGKTKLVALGAASNVLGTINDVRSAAEMARENGALIFIDAVHYAPHHLVDVQEMNCDFLACSAYKFNGPHVGVLYGRRELLESIRFPKVSPSPDTAPERAETGTLNHEGVVGAAAAVDFLASLSGSGKSRRERLEMTFDELHARGCALVEILWEGLSAIDGVRVFGPPPGLPRTPTVSFTVKDLPAKEAARRLSELGVFASSGNFYAGALVERLGLSGKGMVRAGAAIYTTEEEVRWLLESVRSICND